MRKIAFLLTLALLSYGLWWIWSDGGQLREIIGQYVENGDFLTLEAKYTPDQIMDNERQTLLKDDTYTFQDPTLKFYPYLLMEVKYTDADKKTKEGVVLWGLVDGEMVLDTDTWEKTHGFEDAILANANKQDFKILNALAKNNGSLTKDQILKELNLDADLIDPWLNDAIQKHLITQKGNLYQLHFQQPKILVKPLTKISQHLVTKPYNHAMRMDKKYSPYQVEKIGKAAFSDFSVRRTTMIYLPVYTIEVLNPDGSILTSYWNALNGQRINPKYLTRLGL
jgi:hypothetical protein